jgi:hypothetical protein
MKLLKIMLLVIAATLVTPAFAEDNSSSNMEIQKQKAMADKKALVSANMNLTDAEAKGFWPVYEAYQNDLQNINQQLVSLINSYADQFKNNTLTDASSKELLAKMWAIEQTEIDLKREYLPKVSAVLPGVKAVRYIQLEQKLRAALRFELAKGVPLVGDKKEAKK